MPNPTHYKKHRKIILALIFCLQIPVLSFSQYTSKKEKYDFVMNTTKEHCPSAYTILKQDEDSTFTTYLDGTEANKITSDIGTAVHETIHALCFNIGFFNQKGYYISETVKLGVDETTIFNSREIGKMIHDTLKRINRYDTYIGSEKEYGSKVDGIYGLLGEYLAYYHGLKTHSTLLKNDIFKPNFYQTDLLNSYYEFRLFISWYLQYAAKYYPDIYKELYANQNLRVTFTLIDNMFTELVDEILADENLSKWYSMLTKDIATKKDNDEWKKFRMEKVNIENYKEYFK